MLCNDECLLHSKDAHLFFLSLIRSLNELTLLTLFDLVKDVCTLSSQLLKIFEMH